MCLPAWKPAGTWEKRRESMLIIHITYRKELDKEFLLAKTDAVMNTCGILGDGEGLYTSYDKKGVCQACIKLMECQWIMSAMEYWFVSSDNGMLMAIDMLESYRNGISLEQLFTNL